MSRGRILTGVIVATLFIFISVYMGFYIYDALSRPLKTAEAALFTAERTARGDGYFVRDEYALENRDGIVELLIEDGEKIGKGERLALVYSDAAAVSKNARIRELDARIEQLEYAMSPSAETDVSRLDERIDELILDLAESSDQRRLGAFSTYGPELSALIFKRQYTFSEKNVLSSSLAEYKSEKSRLESEMGSGASGIWAQTSGYFCSVNDGLETELTPSKLDGLTVADFDALDRSEKASSSNVGKIVQGFRWYFAAKMREEDAALLEQGARAHLRFESARSDGVDTRVTRVSDPENGSAVVVFSSDSNMSLLMGLRRQRVDVLFSTYEGIRVPKEAIRITEDGGKAVYCLIGLQAELKPVEIIYDSESYYLVKYDPEERNALRPGDEIIVEGKDLEDGKVIGNEW